MPLSAYRFDFELEGPFRQPAFAGSAWRGVFGHALRQSACVTRARDCEGCSLTNSCVYHFLFETSPGPEARKMRLYNAIPHPFVVRPAWRPGQRDLDRGETITLDVNLVGHADRHLPYVIHAFSRAAHSGLGRDRVPMTLRQVMHEQPTGSGDWQRVFDPETGLRPVETRPVPIPSLSAEAVRVVLETPLRLKSGGSLVTPRSFSPRPMLGGLVRRISMLTNFYTDDPLELEFRALAELSDCVALSETRLRWQEWTRYSSRQATSLNMGGVMGSFVLSGEGLAEHWPFLWLGQWTQVGKGASMGLGRYRVEPASLPLLT